MVDVVIRLPEVKRRTGLSRSAIHKRMREGTFPRNFSLGGRSSGWLEREYPSVDQRAAESRDTERCTGAKGLAAAVA